MKKRDKWIGIKRLWASKGQHLSTGKQAEQSLASKRLPPGQRLVSNWPVLDLGVQPTITKRDWRLQISGLVDTPCVLDWESLHRFPLVENVSDIHCVTSWSRYDNHWQGVSTRALLAHIKPKKHARFVMAVSSDSYKTNVPLSALEEPRSLLAIAWEGKPLTRDHGGPVRLLLPHLYLWKSAKWLKQLIFMAEDERGFWENNGYHNHADPWQEERYAYQEKSKS